MRVVRNVPGALVPPEGLPLRFDLRRVVALHRPAV
jgi:hypothetical protein